MNKLKIELDYEGNNKYPYVVLEDYDFHGYIIKKGFRTNFASIPWIVRVFFNTFALDLWSTHHDQRYFEVLVVEEKNWSKIRKLKYLLQSNYLANKLLKHTDTNKLEKFGIRFGTFFGAVWMVFIRPVFKKLGVIK